MTAELQIVIKGSKTFKTSIRDKKDFVATNNSLFIKCLKWEEWESLSFPDLG
jgi:hypothetical protein